MREFKDEAGHSWIATSVERADGDYKGRFALFIYPKTSGESQGVSLADVRWNSARTATRTLTTMSEVELRRRLCSALGRTLVRRG